MLQAGMATIDTHSTSSMQLLCVFCLLLVVVYVGMFNLDNVSKLEIKGMI